MPLCCGPLHSNLPHSFSVVLILSKSSISNLSLFFTFLHAMSSIDCILVCSGYIHFDSVSSHLVLSQESIMLLCFFLQPEFLFQNFSLRFVQGYELRYSWSIRGLLTTAGSTYDMLSFCLKSCNQAIVLNLLSF
jgi:hypothetical protein